MSKIALIAAAGRGSRMMSLTENNPKAMLPFNNKPIIGHHLDYLMKQGYSKVVIVVGYQKEKLINYVNQFYGGLLDIRFAEQKVLNGLAGAVHEGLKVLNANEISSHKLLILLGDVIFDQDISSIDYMNFVGYNFGDDWSRWCMVQTDNNDDVVQFIDKPVDKPNTEKHLVGIYNITDISVFETCLEDSFSAEKINNEFQISSALTLYNRVIGFKSFLFTNYYDLGDLDDLNKTRKNMARHFNNIEVTGMGTIVKSSTNKKKISDEINWYESIDKKVKMFTPHLVDYDKDEGWYELEYIHSSPLQELFLFNLPNESQWFKIFDSINVYLTRTAFPIADRINRDLTNENKEVLINKTKSRVEEVEKLDFTKEEFITINNIVYKNPLKHMEKIYSLVEEYLFKDSKYFHGNLHGDLFFGNMLYDVNTDVLKVIDPRGDYGGLKTSGDIRYDIAKLNHSVNGYYDFIVNGLYYLEESFGKFHYHFYDSNQSNAQKIFDEYVLDNFDRKEIELITGLLFLSMIPLHSDNKNNQKMQFIRAVEFLNKFI